MSDKQTLLKAVEALPEGATWTEITETLLAFVVRRNGEATAERRAELGAAIGVIPGVDPADVWAAAAEADAGLLTPHAEVFARRRAQK